MSVRAILSLTALSATLAGCGDECSDDPIKNPDVPASGVFIGGWGLGNDITPSSRNSSTKRLDLDRAAGVVRVSYLFEGKLVVETYRITGARREMR